MTSTGTATPARDYRLALIDAITTSVGTRVRIEGTGGGCEAITVGPLDNGAVLMITDGDAGVPSGDEHAAEWAENGGGWLVQRFGHAPCGECADCDYPAFVYRSGDLTVGGAVDAVRSALTGADER